MLQDLDVHKIGVFKTMNLFSDSISDTVNEVELVFSNVSLFVRLSATGSSLVLNTDGAKFGPEHRMLETAKAIELLINHLKGRVVRWIWALTSSKACSDRVQFEFFDAQQESGSDCIIQFALFESAIHICSVREIHR